MLIIFTPVLFFTAHRHLCGAEFTSKISNYSCGAKQVQRLVGDLPSYDYGRPNAHNK
jgi:hypothetical protein